MKKKAIIIVLALLMFPLISAIQMDIKKEFRQGEILIAKISGSFLEPIKENEIYFYRGYTQVPFEFELIKIKGDYYISASTKNKAAGNYSLIIKDSEYYVEGGKTSKEDIKSEFLVVGEYADFSVSPGVQISSEGEFSLELQNLKNNEITVTLGDEITASPKEENASGQIGFFDFLFGGGKNNATNKSSEITGQVISISGNDNLNSQIILKSGEIKKIDFEFRDIPDETLKKLSLTSDGFSQEIIIYVLSSKKTPRQETSNIFFEQNFFNISISTSANATRIAYLKNNGETIFENVTFEISDSLKEYIALEPDLIEDFESNKTEKINLIISSKNESETIIGLIKAKTSNSFYAYLDISLQIIPGYVPANQTRNYTNNETPFILKPCRELGGRICGSGKECNITAEFSTDGGCCLGICIEKKKNPAGRIIAIAILVFLIVAYVWFYIKKYKKAKSKPDLLKVAEGGKEK